MKTHTITRWLDETSKQYVVSFADYTELHLKLEIAKKALMNINVDDSALSGKWVSEYELRDIAKEALKELENTGE